MAIDLLDRTCEVCAAFGKCRIESDVYVCEACIAHHEKAIDAAVAAVDRDYALFGSLYGKAIEIGRDMLREVVGVAVKAYCDFDGEATDHAE